MIALIYAHPYPDRSRANHVLLDAVRALPGLVVRPLYDLYPDFGIDVPAEQAVLSEAHTIVWQHPIFWYSVPALLKLWFEQVLALGWAYGDGGTALHGKRCLWVTTTGGDDRAYAEGGIHAQPFETYMPPIRQTARFCGMEWLEPMTLHAAHKVDERDLEVMAIRYRERLVALSARP
ncbi:MAG: glutathione-regulated potassium-efflux system oxidoreductase KefF [Myxococcota bacterium]